MGLNVVDDVKLQAALSGVVDGALRGLVSQVLPVVTSLVDATVNRLQESLGEVMADLTAERQETVNDLHGLLDRLNGASVSLALSGRK